MEHPSRSTTSLLSNTQSPRAWSRVAPSYTCVKFKGHTELQCETRHEVLCQQRGWTCVVLAIAWVKDDMEYEDPPSADDFRVKFTFCIPCSKPAIAAFKTFITHAHLHLSYLDVSNAPVDLTPTTLVYFHALREHQHMLLVGTMLRRDHVDRLFETLRGKLGDRLLSLNLSEINFEDSVMRSCAYRRRAKARCCRLPFFNVQSRMHF